MKLFKKMCIRDSAKGRPHRRGGRRAGRGLSKNHSTGIWKNSKEYADKVRETSNITAFFMNRSFLCSILYFVDRGKAEADALILNGGFLMDYNNYDRGYAEPSMSASDYICRLYTSGQYEGLAPAVGAQYGPHFAQQDPERFGFQPSEQRGGL